jgi:hypothetical protein
MQRGTSADILQTLAKLPDAASMIPKIRDLIHVAEEIHQRKFDGDTLKDICDFVAGTNLRLTSSGRPSIGFSLSSCLMSSEEFNSDGIESPSLLVEVRLITHFPNRRVFMVFRHRVLQRTVR